MKTLSGSIVVGSSVREGRLRFARDITALELDSGDASLTRGGPFILPGFIDVHVHGGGGADTMDGAAAVRELAGFHLRHGTTALLPTTITNPLASVLAALSAVAEVAAEQSAARQAAHAPASEPAATVLGAHLEGPFINPGRLGAQPPWAIAPEAELIDRLLDTGIVRVVTLAPEIARAEDAARRFAAANVRVSVGHTNAAFEQVSSVTRAVAAVGGVVGFTHLFNAMSQLTGREPGAVGAALSDPGAYAEIIFDGHHVHAASFLTAAAAKPGKLLLVTDAMRAAGQAEGVSELGGQEVVVAGGAARLRDGTLAGSVLTMDVALRNAVAAGIDLPTASAMAAGVPASYLGLVDRGSIAVGRRADLVVLGDDLEVKQVYLAGERVV